MNGPDFLDTNVFVYAYDPSVARKQLVAQDLVRKAQAGEAVTSAQVLAELASVLLHKLKPAASPEDVISLMDALGSIHSVTSSASLVRRAIQARARYGIHFYDGLVVAAAEAAGCRRILSEDLADGQTYFEIAVQNPFTP